MECPSWLCRKARTSSSTRRHFEAGGAGLALRGVEVTTESIRASAMRLLHDSRYRRHAERYAPRDLRNAECR